MTEETKATPQGEKSKLTREEQTVKLLPALRHYMPQILMVGQMYNKAYPFDKTDGAVLDAVTVAVPLRHFMVMSGVCANLVAGDMEKNPPKEEAAPKTEAA